MSFDLSIQIDGNTQMVQVKDLQDNFGTKLKQSVLKGLLHYEFSVQQNLRSGKFGIKNRNNAAGLLGSMKVSAKITEMGFMGTVIFQKIYARIQEEGGKINITKKMSKFAWFKFFETGNTMWKAIALSKGGQITIPKHEYAKGTLKEESKTIIDVIARSLLN